MSTATEIAEREALEAEAENPDDEPEPDEPEPDEPGNEPEPEPAEPPSDVAAEQAFVKLDKAAQNYGKAVMKAVDGSPVAPDKCPCCSIPGLVFPYNPEDIDDYDRKLAVDAYFGAPEVKYRKDTTRVECPDCDGHGRVLTGSKHVNHLTDNCMTCAGQGYVAATSTAATQPPLYSIPTGNPIGPPNPPPGMPNDQWGRAWGALNYGIDPSTNGGQW